LKRRKDNNVIQITYIIKNNAAIIIFGIILIYIIASIIIAVTKKPIPTFKVTESNINNDINCTGLAIRNEKIFNSTKSGYICYYVREGERVSNGEIVCTIDENGDLMEKLSSAEAGTTVFKDEDYKEIRNYISTYKASYSNVNFVAVYNFKNDVASKVLELSNEILMKSSTSSKLRDSLQSIKSNESGIIAFYIDGYETKTVSTLKDTDFNTDIYEKNIINSGDIVNNNTTVFKLCADESWDIVCKISKEQAASLQEIVDSSKNPRVTFKLNNSEYNITANFDLIEKEGNNYIDIHMTRYMVDYIYQRFISVDIVLNQYEGLKIPNTAITKKAVYKLPVEYITAGGNDSTSDNVYVQSRAEDGSVTAKQIDLIIYKKDEEFYYVDPDSFSEGDVIVQMDTNDTIAAALLSSDYIDGVYQVNKGMADFMMVDVIKVGDEFSIVDKKGKLKKYDNIIMNSEGIIENQIIY